LGVSPTVSLGTALLIFFGVGLLAVIVAFLFQMVSGVYAMVTSFRYFRQI
jgi:hypothetical protein